MRPRLRRKPRKPAQIAPNGIRNLFAP
jgi:hypothetical protein